MTKTWWHLAGARRIPSEYEIVSSRLLHHPERGFEVATPVQRWHERHQGGSRFRLPDPEAFHDPRRTTYRSWIALQRDQEALLDGLEDAHAGAVLEPGPGAGSLEFLERVLAPLRHPVHGLMMAAAYVGHLAPSGKIAIAALFQAGDEVRRVHRLAWRLGIHRRRQPGLGDGSRRSFEEDPVWQPLRRVLERLLVTWDWGESFAALDLVLKPVLDAFLLAHAAAFARAAADPVLETMFRSFDADCRWHREWSRELAATALRQAPENGEPLGEWVRRWRPLALDAVAAFRPVLVAIPGGSEAGFDAALDAADDVLVRHLAAAGVRA